MRREILQGIKIDLDPVALHLGENLQQRLFHSVIQVRGRRLYQILAYSFLKRQQNGCFFAPVR